MPFRSTRHLDKTESLGLPRELINNKFGADNTAKLATEFCELRLGDIIREATYEKFHA